MWGDPYPAVPGGTEPTGGNSSRLLRFGGSDRARLGLPGLQEALGLRPPAQGRLSPLTPSSRLPGPRPPRSRACPGPRLLPPRRDEGASAAALKGSVGGKSWLRAPRPPRGGPPGLPGRAAEEPGALAGVGGPCGRTRLLCSLRKFSRNGTNSFRSGRSERSAAASPGSSWGKSGERVSCQPRARAAERPPVGAHSARVTASRPGARGPKRSYLPRKADSDQAWGRVSAVTSELSALRAIHRTAAATDTSSRSSDSKTAAIPVQALRGECAGAARRGRPCRGGAGAEGRPLGRGAEGRGLGWRNFPRLREASLRPPVEAGAGSAVPNYRPGGVGTAGAPLWVSPALAVLPEG